MAEDGCSREEDGVTRRNVLASMSVATVAGSGIAAGRPDDENTLDGVEYERLSAGQQRAEVLSTVRSSRERRIFRRFFRQKYGARLETGETEVVEVSVDRDDRVEYVVNVPLVGFKPEKYDNADRAGVAFTVTSDSVSGASGSVTWIDETETNDKVSETEMFRLSDGSVESTSTTVTTQDVNGQSGRIGTAASTECEACKAAYSALAAVGCFFTVSGLCALSAVPTGGGVLTVCAAVLAGVCGAASSGDFLTGYSPEGICSGAAAHGEPADWGFCS